MFRSIVKVLENYQRLFTGKGLNSNELMLIEKDVIISNEKALAIWMNNYFANITIDLDLKRNSENVYDPPTNVCSIKKKIQGHQNILKIEEVFIVTDLFSFHEIIEDEL